jgi:hypothetical protein
MFDLVFVIRSFPSLRISPFLKSIWLVVVRKDMKHRLEAKLLHQTAAHGHSSIAVLLVQRIWTDLCETYLEMVTYYHDMY